MSLISLAKYRRRIGKNLNQRDTITVRRMVDGYLKLMYPNGELKKLGGGKLIAL